MKLNRRHLRRLIESVINEQDNPGSKFASSVKKGAQNKSDANKQKATQELQKTYDWFVREVFPAIENDEWPIVADDDYGFQFNPKHKKVVMPFSDQYIKKGTRWDSINSFTEMKAGPKSMQPPGKFSLANVYELLEKSVIVNDLSVTMQSDQPDEFEAEVAKSKNKPVKSSGRASGEDDPAKDSSLNESLSRGSMYRRRYHGRY